MSLKFLSPTINLTFDQDDYMFFCENLKYVKTAQLTEDKQSALKYPVGILYYPELKKTIKIHFVHYKNFSDAKYTFKKRLSRINYNNIVYLFNAFNLTKNIADRFRCLNAKKKICVYINYLGEDELSSIDNCKFFKLKIKIPYNRDMLSFKSAFGRKMYIDSINFDFHNYIFSNHHK